MDSKGDNDGEGDNGGGGGEDIGGIQIAALGGEGGAHADTGGGTPSSDPKPAQPPALPHAKPAQA